VDPSTLVGVALGWGALMTAMLLEGMSPTTFVNVPALVLVCLGTAGATIASFRFAHLRQVAGMLRQTVRGTEDTSETIAMMVRLAAFARKHGLLEMERTLGDVSDPFVRRAFSLVIDGQDPDAVRYSLEDEFAQTEERHRIGERLFTAAGGYAPTLGIIGTVVGLVHMLQNLSDPGRIGPAIATAFLATLYGVSVANLMLLPVANKLRAQHEQEFMVKRVVMEGVLGVARGDNPTELQERMLVLLPPKAREHYAKARRASREGAAPSAPSPAPGAHS